MSRKKPLAVLAVLCVMALALGVFSGCGTTQTSLNVVKLDSGKISGVQQGGTWTYLGIPYAKPPVGNLRWKPPEAPVAWSGTRACTQYGATCPQPPGPVSFGNESEDCLYLNVWTPAKTPTEKLPVMVWIYGGAFTTGSGSDPRFNGVNLTKQGVIVVTINYRVGMFGFMAHPQLSQESAHHSSGNYGLMDMIQALKWVKTNINGFGGDPGRVTVFGQSRGGVDTVSPRKPPCQGVVPACHIRERAPLALRVDRPHEPDPQRCGENRGADCRKSWPCRCE